MIKAVYLAFFFAGVGAPTDGYPPAQPGGMNGPDRAHICLIERKGGDFTPT